MENQQLDEGIIETENISKLEDLQLNGIQFEGKENCYDGVEGDNELSALDEYLTKSNSLSPISVVKIPQRVKNELSLLDLPPELILHILTFLNARFTLCVLCQVCKTFYEVLCSEASWKTRFAKRWPHRDRKEDYNYVASWKKVCVEHEDMDKFWQNPEEDLDFFQLKQHFAPVDAVLVMGGGRLCVSGSRDRSIGIWDLTKIRGQEDTENAFIHHLDGHKGWVWSLASDPTGDARICSGSWDNAVKFWDLRGDTVEMSSIREHRSAVLCMEWKYDTLVTGCFDKHVRMFDLRASNQLVAKLKYHNRPVLCLAVDDQYIVSGSEDKTVCVYDKRAGSILKTLQLPSPAFSICRSLSAGYNYLRVGGRAGHVYLIDVTNNAYNALESSIDLGLGPKGKINGICHYGGAVVASSSDHSIKVLEPSQVPVQICSLDKHTGDVASVHSNSGILASGSSDLSVGIWRPKSLRPSD